MGHGGGGGSGNLPSLSTFMESLVPPPLPGKGQKAVLCIGRTRQDADATGGFCPARLWLARLSSLFPKRIPRSSKARRTAPALRQGAGKRGRVLCCRRFQCPFVFLSQTGADLPLGWRL